MLRNSYDKTPFDVAVYYKKKTVAELLIQHIQNNYMV
jgi:hypothetical protein